MHAVTLIQPWATAMVLAPRRARVAPKRVENRGWELPDRHIGTRLALHAGKKRPDKGNIHFVARHLGIDPAEVQCPTGGIVALVTFKGNVTSKRELEASQHPWWFGPVGWVVEKVEPLPRVVQCLGQLGIWKVPTEVEARILEQLGGRAA